jgi:hypothetical protein
VIGRRAARSMTVEIAQQELPGWLALPATSVEPAP